MKSSPSLRGESTSTCAHVCMCGCVDEMQKARNGAPLFFSLTHWKHMKRIIFSTQNRNRNKRAGKQKNQINSFPWSSTSAEHPSVDANRICVIFFYSLCHSCCFSLLSIQNLHTIFRSFSVGCFRWLILLHNNALQQHQRQQSAVTVNRKRGKNNGDDNSLSQKKNMMMFI